MCWTGLRSRYPAGIASPLTESRYAGAIGSICPADGINLSLLAFWREIENKLLDSYEWLVNTRDIDIRLRKNLLFV
jgi:hypothetical protein